MVYPAALGVYEEKMRYTDIEKGKGVVNILLLSRQILLGHNHTSCFFGGLGTKPAGFYPHGSIHTAILYRYGNLTSS